MGHAPSSADMSVRSSPHVRSSGYRPPQSTRLLVSSRSQPAAALLAAARDAFTDAIVAAVGVSAVLAIVAAVVTVTLLRHAKAIH
jgi:hypothetical protein